MLAGSRLETCMPCLVAPETADPAIVDYPDAYWGANVARLQRVKRSYDPHELFTFPQAVRP